MRIRKHDWKAGDVSLTVENSDDLWTLRTVVQEGDSVRGSTERKLKIGGSEEKGAVIRRRMTLTIKVEKVEYAEDGSSLRCLGSITDGPDDVPRGDHHSFVLEPGSEIALIKGSWPKYLQEKLERATRLDAGILVVLFDREEAKFFGVTKRGVDELTRLKGDVAKKAVDEKKAANFYKEIVDQLIQYADRGQYRHIVAGAPAFWREYVERELPDELRAKTVMTTISDVDKTAIRELLSRPEVAKLLKESSMLTELGLVEEVMKGLGKESVAYGKEAVQELLLLGNVQSLIVTEKTLAEERKKGAEAFAALEVLLRRCEEARGEVHVLSTEEAMAKIDALGGIVALKRW